MTHNWRLLLQKSDETRISLGIDAYNDITGKMYQYDDHVPNHTGVVRVAIKLISVNVEQRPQNGNVANVPLNLFCQM